MLQIRKRIIWALLYSHAVLHLSKRSHDIHSVCLACCLLNRWILWHISTDLLLSYPVGATHIYFHKDVVFLILISLKFVVSMDPQAYHLIPNRELSLCLLIVLCEGLQLLYCVRLQHCSQEFDVLFRVLMPRLPLSVLQPLRPRLANTHVDPGIIWQRRKCLIQCRMHLCWCTLKEFSAT